MITKQQQQRVKQLLKEGAPQTEIAKRVGTTRHQVRKILDQIKIDTGEEKEETSYVSKLEDFRTEITGWLFEKNMSAFLIHQRLVDKKIICSYSSVKRFVRSLRKQEVYVPVITRPGEEAQVDYGFLGVFEKEGRQIKVWVFNMVLSFSRYAFYCIATEQTVVSFTHCHQQAFEFFGGVPASIKIDNLGAGVIEADFFEPHFQDRYLDFLSHYHSTAITARICRGQDKGKVESGIKYVKNRFMKNLEHRDYEKLTCDLKKWNKQECNFRQHGTTRKTVVDEFILNEKPELIPLPDERYAVFEREQRKVDSYGHIYYQYNFYSVPFQYAGEILTVENNRSIIRIFKGNKYIATHIICKKKGAFITAEGHKPFYKQVKTDQFYREKLEKIGDAAVLLMTHLKTLKPFHWKNMVKGILALAKLYPNAVVNKSCEQAVKAGLYSFKEVQKICQQSLSPKEKNPEHFPKGVGGYYHDLSIYDDLANQMLKKTFKPQTNNCHD